MGGGRKGGPSGCGQLGHVAMKWKEKLRPDGFGLVQT